MPPRIDACIHKEQKKNLVAILFDGFFGKHVRVVENMLRKVTIHYSRGQPVLMMVTIIKSKLSQQMTRKKLLMISNG